MDSIDKLSKRAREEYNKLSQKLQDIVIADKQREPKLTEGEKSEVDALEARIEQLRPAIQKIMDLLRAKEERLAGLEKGILDKIIEGTEVDALVSELVILRPAIPLLSEAQRAAHFEVSVAEQRINKIKKEARERELRLEVENEQ
jgi:hypothetical protein